MAKKKNTTTSDLAWLAYGPEQIEGLDHLGTQVVSVNLYSQLLPGLTTVTERVRLVALYPWILHRYASSGGKRGDRLGWLRWFRSFEFAYALVCATQPASDVTGVTGLRTARRLLRGRDDRYVVTIRDHADVNDKGESITGAYVRSPQGGLNIYRGAIVQLGIVGDVDDVGLPDLKIQPPGRALCEALDADPAFAALATMVARGHGTVSEFRELGEQLRPSAISDGSTEQRALRGIVAASGTPFVEWQALHDATARRAALALIIDYVRALRGVAEPKIDGNITYLLRWGLHAKVLPDAQPWRVPPAVETWRTAWSGYTRNDLLVYALDALLHVAIEVLRSSPLSPRALAAEVARLAVPNDCSVGDWLEDVKRLRSQGEGTFDDGGTWSAWTALEDALGTDSVERVPALAIGLLAHVREDAGTLATDRFNAFPRPHVVDSFEVHYGRLLDRFDEHRAQALSEFVRDLVLEWVVLRHLRVATRMRSWPRTSTTTTRSSRLERRCVARIAPGVIE